MCCLHASKSTTEPCLGLCWFALDHVLSKIRHVKLNMLVVWCSMLFSRKSFHALFFGGCWILSEFATGSVMLLPPTRSCSFSGGSAEKGWSWSEWTTKGSGRADPPGWQRWRWARSWCGRCASQWQVDTPPSRGWKETVGDQEPVQQDRVWWSNNGAPWEI